MLNGSSTAGSLTSTARAWVIGLTLCAGGACAMAQDSVGLNTDGGNGLPGDGLSIFTASAPSQRTTYVLDLAPLVSSWGTLYGVGPVLKSARVSTTRFNAVNGPSAISPLIDAPTIASTQYPRWMQAGGGVNTTQNNPALSTQETLSGQVQRVGVAVLDFDELPQGNALTFVNSITSASIAYLPQNPERLYVTRVLAASNTPTGTQDRSQFGLGAVAPDGDVAFRADGFNATGTNILLNDNYFVVDAQARTTTPNTIDNAGGVNATDWPLVRNAVTIATPALVPALGSSPQVVLGADFTGQLVARVGTSSPTLTTAHRPGTIDHRGAPTYSEVPLFAGTRGTGAILARSISGGGKTDAISVFGVTPAGAIVPGRTLTIPANLSDACDSFAWPIAGGDFRQYDSQAVFRGGTGPAAVGRDLQGRGLVAATIYNGSQAGTNNPFNAIAAARFDPTNPNAAPTWTLIAWVNPVQSDGKDILGDYGLDGAPGTGDAGEGDGQINASDAPIGRLASTAQGPSGFAGPSLSAPAFDSAGNAYFIATVALRRQAGTIIVEDFSEALLRAVLDPTTFCYRLELLLRPGQVLGGQNSSRDYRVAFLGLADDDSVASSTLWSGSVTASPWANASTSLLPNRAPQHLGGLVVSSRIVYDVNQDGNFDDPTAPGGNPASVDQAYNAVLYLGNIMSAGPACNDVDFNNDGIEQDPTDIEAFLSVYSGGSCVPSTQTCDPLDFNNDGIEQDPTDIEAFLSVYSGGPCI